MQLELEPEVIQGLLALQTAQLAASGVEMAAMRGTIAAMEVDRRAKEEEIMRLRDHAAGQQALIAKLQALLSQVLKVEFANNEHHHQAQLQVQAPETRYFGGGAGSDDSALDIVDDTSETSDIVSPPEIVDDTSDTAGSQASSPASSDTAADTVRDIPDAIVPFSRGHEKSWKKRYLTRAKQLLAASSGRGLVVLKSEELCWAEYPALARVLKPALKLAATGTEPVAGGILTKFPVLEVVLDSPLGRAYLGSYTLAAPVTLSALEYRGLSAENKAFITTKSASHSMRGQAEARSIPQEYLAGERRAVAYELKRIGYNRAIERSILGAP